MIACKTLRRGARGRYSGFAWPRPGRWVVVHGPLEPGRRGIHACRPGDLPAWLDDELWLVELDGTLIEHDELLVASRGRLLRRVRGWSDDAARRFAVACVGRARDGAVRALRQAGRERAAASLSRARGLDAIERAAAAEAGAAEGADPVGLAADAACLARGRRPDAWQATQVDVAQSAQATAANLGFVVAHAAGLEAVRASGPQAYADGFAAERAWQAAWLASRLELQLAISAGGDV